VRRVGGRGKGTRLWSKKVGGEEDFLFWGRATKKKGKKREKKGGEGKGSESGLGGQGEERRRKGGDCALKGEKEELT